MKYALTIILVAIVVAMAAVMIDRALRPDRSDDLDEQYRALQEQLAQANQHRDSLRAVSAARADTVAALQDTLVTLRADLAASQALNTAQSRNLTAIRERLTYVPSNDTLLRDLSRIARDIAAGRRPGADGPGR